LAFAGPHSDGDAGGRRRTHQLFYSSCNAPLLHCQNAQKKATPGHIRRTPHSPKSDASLLHCQNAQKKATPGHIRRTPTQSKTRRITVTLPKRAKKGNARPYKQRPPHSPKPDCMGAFAYILGVNRLFLRSLLFYTFPIILIDHNLTQFTDQWFFRVGSCTLVFVC